MKATRQQQLVSEIVHALDEHLGERSTKALDIAADISDAALKIGDARLARVFVSETITATNEFCRLVSSRANKQCPEKPKNHDGVQGSERW